MMCACLMKTRRKQRKMRTIDLLCKCGRTLTVDAKPEDIAAVAGASHWRVTGPTTAVCPYCRWHHD